MNKQEFLELVDDAIFEIRDIDDRRCTIVVADDDGIEWGYDGVDYDWDDISFTLDDLRWRGDPKCFGEAMTEFVMPTRVVKAFESTRLSLTEWDKSLQEAGVTEGEEYDSFCKALEAFGRMTLSVLKMK